MAHRGGGRAGQRWPALLLSLAVPAVLVAGLLFLLIRGRGVVETAVAGLAGWLPVGYAFAAGMVASVNPCGVMLLPSYVVFQLEPDGEGTASGPGVRVRKGLAIGAMATAGFMAIFGTMGAIVASGGVWLTAAFPYAGAVVGGLMVLLGSWLLVTRRTLGIAAATRLTFGQQRNLGSFFLFGIAYAVGSLGCTLPIFLAVVGGSLVGPDWAASLGQFVAYSLGMGLVLITVTVAAALFRGAVTRLLRRIVPYVHRVGALFLMGAGAYLVYYWVSVAGL